jgi:hypothetical protein
MWSCRNSWWYKKATGDTNHDFEHIFSIDEDDPIRAVVEERVAANKDPGPQSRLIVGMPPNNNAAWNRACAAADPSTKIFIQVSDDFEAPDNWNSVVAGRLHSAGGWDKPLVLGVADPHFTPPYSGDGACLTIYVTTRAHIEKCGYFLQPEYLSMMSDDDIACKASLDRTLVDAYDIQFYHHWHGSDTDPKRDGTYTRHHTKECWTVGGNVYGERFYAAFPDIVTDADPDRDLSDNEQEFLVPPHLVEQYAKTFGDRRRQRGWACVQNKPPEDEMRKAWFAGDWAKCREAVTENVLKPQHMRFCAGRFLAHAGVFLWNICSQQLGDKEPMGVNNQGWRDYLGNHNFAITGP